MSTITATSQAGTNALSAYYSPQLSFSTSLALPAPSDTSPPAPSTFGFDTYQSQYAGLLAVQPPATQLATPGSYEPSVQVATPIIDRILPPIQQSVQQFAAQSETFNAFQLLGPFGLGTNVDYYG